MPVCYYGHVASVQRSPTCTLSALLAENLSRTLALLAFVDLVPDSLSLSFNLGDCTAYGLQRPAGMPVCTAGAGKLLLKRGSTWGGGSRALCSRGGVTVFMCAWWLWFIMDRASRCTLSKHCVTVTN